MSFLSLIPEGVDFELYEFIDLESLLQLRLSEQYLNRRTLEFSKAKFNLESSELNNFIQKINEVDRVIKQASQNIWGIVGTCASNVWRINKEELSLSDKKPALFPEFYHELMHLKKMHDSLKYELILATQILPNSYKKIVLEKFPEIEKAVNNFAIGFIGTHKIHPCSNALQFTAAIYSPQKDKILLQTLFLEKKFKLLQEGNIIKFPVFDFRIDREWAYLKIDQKRMHIFNPNIDEIPIEKQLSDSAH